MQNKPAEPQTGRKMKEEILEKIRQICESEGQEGFFKDEDPEEILEILLLLEGKKIIDLEKSSLEYYIERIKQFIGI